MRPPTILSTPLVIGTMALAVVAFLFVIDTANNPDGAGGVYIFPQRNTTNTNAGETTNTNINENETTNSSLNANTNSSPAASAFTLSTPENTSDWAVYTNATYGFSVRYPSEYVVTANTPQSVRLVKTIPAGDVNQGENGGNNVVAILIYDPSNLSTLHSTAQAEYAWAIGGFADSRPDYLSTQVTGLINGATWQRVNVTSGIETIQGYYHRDGEQVTLISDSRITSDTTNGAIVSSFTLTN